MRIVGRESRVWSSYPHSIAWEPRSWREAAILLLSYDWENRVVEIPENPGRPTYDSETLPGVTRRCCIAEGLVEAITAKLATIVLSPGVGDLPDGEVDRLSTLLKSLASSTKPKE